MQQRPQAHSAQMVGQFALRVFDIGSAPNKSATNLCWPRFESKGLFLVGLGHSDPPGRVISWEEANSLPMPESP